jgi:hypothetical protein
MENEKESALSRYALDQCGNALERFASVDVFKPVKAHYAEGLLRGHDLRGVDTGKSEIEGIDERIGDSIDLFARVAREIADSPASGTEKVS